MLAVAVHLFGNDRARTDEAHVSAQDIPELREFIQAVFPQEAADSGNAGVFLELEVPFPFRPQIGPFGQKALKNLLSVGHHGAKLVAGEEFAAMAHPLMGEYDLGAAKPHQDGDQCHQWRQENQQERGADHIQCAFAGPEPRH